jgi:hypothetical protein
MESYRPLLLRFYLTRELLRGWRILRGVAAVSSSQKAHRVAWPFYPHLATDKTRLLDAKTTLDFADLDDF